MPELPEVETTKRSLQPLVGKQVNRIEVFQPKLRWPIPDNLTELQTFTLHRIDRRAKYLILHFISPDNATLTKALIIHLGMSGSLQQYPVGTNKRKHDHLIFHFAKVNLPELQPTQLHYHDPRRFGAVVWFDAYADKLLPHLGIEPLEDAFTGDYLYHRIHRLNLNTASKANTISKISTESTANTVKANGRSSVKKPIARPIKAVIMDQAFVVGVGNIYATESLFLARIHPSTPANLVSKAQLLNLVLHIKAILLKSIKQGGSTLRDFTVAQGKTGYFQQALNIYGRYKAPCPTCNTTIEKVIITGRASTFCPNCQPLINADCRY